MSVSELNSQQNIIAVVVDDSRSMNIDDSGGKTREAAALSALDNGVLAGLQKKFQTRVYRLGSKLTGVDGPQNDCAGGSGYAHWRQLETTHSRHRGFACGCRPAAKRR